MSASSFRVTCLLAIAFCSSLSAIGQDTESKKDRKTQNEIAALGRAYSGMIQRSDVVSIEKILADDYLLADEEGKVFTKREDLATYPDKKERVNITSIEYIDQKVRLLAPNVAIEHSTIRFVGTSNGKPFDITERCTTTWAKRGGKWLIVADHFSVRPPVKLNVAGSAD